MLLFSYVKVTGSRIDGNEVLVQAGPLDGATPFGVSITASDFKVVDTSSGSEVFVGRSFCLTEQRRRARRLGS